MSQQFNELHRPKTLDKIIGHENVVTRLRGIIELKRWPSAMMFVGPTSAGKTTLARCFVAEVNGQSEGHPDYLEQNAAVNGKIEDMRELLEVAILLPQRGKRRFITIDECHRLTDAAEQAILKPLEKAPPKTTFILCTMEPERLHRALANRCQQFILETHSKENIVRYIKRIAKKENMDYVDKKMMSKIANNSNGEMRTAAILMESLFQYAAVNKKVSVDDLDGVISSTQTKDDSVAIRIMVGVYAKKFSYVQKAILDIQDGFGITNKLIWLNSFMLNDYILKGEKHPKVWPSKYNLELKRKVDELVQQGAVKKEEQLRLFATTQQHLVALRQQAASFLVPEQNLIGARLYDLIRSLK